MNKNHTFVVLAYKKSEYLEDCIKSVLNQSVKTNVIIATSTPNDYIKKLADKYKINIKVNKNPKGIGYDFDFAIDCAKTKLVTIAHQDDLYDEDYVKEIIDIYDKEKNAIIIFPNYYEIRNNDKIYSNKNLKIKNILLFPLRIKGFAGTKFFKRSVLRFGCSIGCPAVTFVKDRCPNEIFSSNLKCNVDWQAWEKLSKLSGKFIYINKYLMGHRIHEESTTTKIIEDNIRTKEDFIMFRKFWPTPIAKILCRLYQKSENSNKIKE